MHDCPDCGQACDCDGEDTWFDWDSDAAMECECDCVVCEEFDEDSYLYDDEDGDVEDEEIANAR